MEKLETRKCQICQKKDVVKQFHSHNAVWSCLGQSPSERERRTNPKQYCALFTCSASTAFHIEVTCTMETAFSTLCVDSWQGEAKHDQ